MQILYPDAHPRFQPEVLDKKVCPEFLEQIFNIRQTMLENIRNCKLEYILCIPS